MRLSHTLLLGAACLALAGCGGQPPAQPANEVQGRPGLLDPDKVMAERWGRMFTDPGAVVAAANDFGYDVAPYAAAEGGYRAEGKEQVLPEARAPLTVRARFAATGPAADRIDRIAFAFDVSDTTDRETKAARENQGTPSRIVRGFLQRFEVGAGDEVRNAIERFEPVSVDRYGARIAVESRPLEAAGKNARRLTVTITPAGAPAAPQNQS